MDSHAHIRFGNSGFLVTMARVMMSVILCTAVLARGSGGESVRETLVRQSTQSSEGSSIVKDEDYYASHRWHAMSVEETGSPTAAPTPAPPPQCPDANNCWDCMGISGCVWCEDNINGSCIGEASPYPKPCGGCDSDKCHRLTCGVEANALFFVLIPMAIAFPLGFMLFYCWYKNWCRKKELKWQLDSGIQRSVTDGLKRRTKYEELYEDEAPDAGFHDLQDSLRAKYERKKRKSRRSSVMPEENDSD